MTGYFEGSMHVKKTKMLTEGAMLAAVFGVCLLIALYVPLIRLVAIIFLVLPFIIFCSKYPLKYIIVFSAVCLLVSALMGTVASLPVAVLFGSTGFVMGYCIQLKKTKFFTYVASSLMFLTGMITIMFFSLKFFHLNIIAENLKTMQQSIEQSKAILSALGQESAYKERFAQMADSVSLVYTVYLPSFLLLSAFIMVLILVAINFPIAKRFGVPAPKWNPFRELRLPKNILWYYIIVMAAYLLMRADTSSFLAKAVLNLMLIFQILILLQGYSLLNFFSYTKKWPKGIFALAVILSLMFSPLLYLVMIFGIMDLGFDFRQMIQR
ncbi:membrane protein [Weizmannia acidilactici]|uniref:Membrane protein n=2 Tax=Weizmannia acidilactici TaxID=2607726 RepID=A0A5J4JF33_9BACI|nr:membrane protein [Weizmannia acidilactici]GER70039.1 membrane protein [Weizmannia acidilactici]